MDITVTGRGVGIPDRFEDYAIEKSERVEHLAEKSLALEIKVLRHHETHGTSGDDRVELTLIGPGPIVRAESGGADKYAAFDMALSGESPRPSLDVWKEMEGATPMGYVEGTSFPGTFEHIASGYAAGYYGYMWAKVIALDLVSVFGADLMNSGVGRRVREMILSRGSEQPARSLVEQFLGRPVSSEAFFARIRGE